MSDKKHKSGYELLKLKYNMLLDTHKEEMAKGRDKVNELQTIVERQQTRISELTAKLHAVRERRSYYRDKNDALWEHMGWFKRLTWNLKHK